MYERVRKMMIFFSYMCAHICDVSDFLGVCSSQNIVFPYFFPPLFFSFSPRLGPPRTSALWFAYLSFLPHTLVVAPTNGQCTGRATRPRHPACFSQRDACPPEMPRPCPLK